MPDATILVRLKSFARSLWENPAPFEKSVYFKIEESENNELAHENESILPPIKPKSNNWWMKIFCATILLLNIIGLGMIFALVKQDRHLHSYEKYYVFPERKASFSLLSCSFTHCFTPSSHCQKWNMKQENFIPKIHFRAQIQKPYGILVCQKRKDLPWLRSQNSLICPGSPFQGGHHRYGISWGHQYHCVVCNLFQ